MPFAALTLLLLSAQPATPPPPPCASPLHHQFDFWIGGWDVTDRAGKFAGTNRIERADGGCVLVENWSSAGGGYTGRSLNSVGGDGGWHQTWVDSSGLRLELAGGLANGKMVLEGDTPATRPGGPPVKNRISWSPQPDGIVRQHWETSEDEGKTYVTAFDGLYHPVKEAAVSNAVSNAVSKTTSLLHTLAGGWIGSGVVMKREAHVELDVAPVLGEKYYRLRWLNNGGKDGRELFEGLAVYEERPDGTLAATWWDSGAARYGVSATVDGSSLTALWGERGRTVYRLLESGELEVVDSIKQPDGSWSEFGRTRLKRK